MGRKSNKKAENLLAKLSKKEIAELLAKYNSSTDYEEIENKFNIKSNNPYIKFTEEDGVWLFDKRGSLNRLPEYKTEYWQKQSNKNLEECLYVLATGKGSN